MTREQLLFRAIMGLKQALNSLESFTFVPEAALEFASGQATDAVECIARLQHPEWPNPEEPVPGSQKALIMEQMSKTRLAEFARRMGVGNHQNDNLSDVLKRSIDLENNKRAEGNNPS